MNLLLYYTVTETILHLKPDKHEFFVFEFFENVQSLRSQRPETRVFRKTNSISPSYSSFKDFRVDSVCAKIGSALTQPAMRLVLR